MLVQSDPPVKGDLIGFYNDVFVPVMETFVRGLVVGGSDKELRADVQPLPEIKTTRVHSPRRVARNTGLTVSPISEKRKAVSNSPQGSPLAASRVSYAFHQSPSKNLEAINRHLRDQSVDPSPDGKRPLKRSRLGLLVDTAAAANALQPQPSPTKVLRDALMGPANPPVRVRAPVYSDAGQLVADDSLGVQKLPDSP